MRLQLWCVGSGLVLLFAGLVGMAPVAQAAQIAATATNEAAPRRSEALKPPFDWVCGKEAD